MNIKFFKQLDGLTEKYIRDLAISIYFIKFENGHEICKYGEYGDEFFVIMKGNVNVFIPNHSIDKWKINYERMHKLEKWKQECFTDRLERMVTRYIKKFEI